MRKAAGRGALGWAVRLGAWGLAAAWGYKAISSARGLRQVPDLHRPEFDAEPEASPQLTAVVPARNEEAAVGSCVQSLLLQSYAALDVIAVDDRSEDRTGAILDGLAGTAAGRLRVLHVQELPEGWLGKTNALAQAIALAEQASDSAWLLFTDADVHFAPDALRRALSYAVRERADHLILLPTPLAKSPGEAIMLGFFQVMGAWAVRLWRVSDPSSTRDALGVGAFALLRSSALREIGGLEPLRMAILEDLTLGQRIKAAGLRQRIAFGPGLVTVHWAPGALGVVDVLTKNIFALFQFEPWRLLAGCCGLLAMTLPPLLGLAYAPTRVPSVLTLAAIAWLYHQIAGYSRVPAWTFWLYPVGVGLTIYSMLRSMLITLAQGGVRWRGTFYPLAELRAADRLQL